MGRASVSEGYIGRLTSAAFVPVKRSNSKYILVSRPRGTSVLLRDESDQGQGVNKIERPRLDVILEGSVADPSCASSIHLSMEPIAYRLRNAEDGTNYSHRQSDDPSRPPFTAFRAGGRKRASLSGPEILRTRNSKGKSPALRSYGCVTHART